MGEIMKTEKNTRNGRQFNLTLSKDREQKIAEILGQMPALATKTGVINHGIYDLHKKLCKKSVSEFIDQGSKTIVDRAEDGALFICQIDSALPKEKQYIFLENDAEIDFVVEALKKERGLK
jgi:hypothetical protein